MRNARIIAVAALALVSIGCGANGSRPNAVLSAGPRADDSSAKSDARNLVSFVEACFADTADYRACATVPALGGSGLSLGPGPGQVSVSAPNAGSYVVTAHSQSGASFAIARAAGTIARTCPRDPVSCPDGTW